MTPKDSSRLPLFLCVRRTINPPGANSKVSPEVSLDFGRLVHKSAEVVGDTFGDTFSVVAVAFKAGSGQVSEPCRIASPMRLFRRRTPFRRIFGDTFGDTLPLYPVPRLATLCESTITCKSMIGKALCGRYAPACTPLQLWKKRTQNPPRATSWGGRPPGTKESFLECATYELHFRLCPECAQILQDAIRADLSSSRPQLN
jgi:hypothetical protein